ncbi:MAG: mechanosensitive ion channel [Desulfobacteraceae bacterium]|nr:mechanosensitive ion channel [Desulfobacteraceae bacterium]
MMGTGYKWAILAGALVFLLLSPQGPAWAEDKSPPSTGNPETVPVSTAYSPEAIDSRIKALQEIIVSLTKSRIPATAEQLMIEPSDLEYRKQLYGKLRSAYGHLSALLARQADIIRDESLYTEKLEIHQQQGMLEKPPYPLSFYDGLLSERNTLEQFQDNFPAVQEAARQSLENSRLHAQDIQRQLRLSSDQLKLSREPKASATANWTIELQKIEEEHAVVVEQQDKVILSNLDAENRLNKQKIALVERQIEWVRSHLQFSESDLSRQTAIIEKKRQALDKQLETLAEEKKKIDAQWLESRTDYATAVFETDNLKAKINLEKQETWKTVYQTLIEQTGMMIGLLEQQHELWVRRHSLVKNGVDSKLLSRWREATDTGIRNIGQTIVLEQGRQAALFQQMDALEKLADDNPSAELSSALKSRVQALQKLSRHRLEYLSTLLSTEQLNRRFYDELSRQAGQRSWTERLDSIGNLVVTAWQYELWAIDSRPVTVKKLITALLITVIGLIITRIALRHFSRRVLARAQLKTTTASNIEKLLLYSSYILLGLLALRIVNIPLAAFAFLGGAVAIGFGFGAQNLINNFISGFMIMGEKPIGLGDLIEIDGVLGKVEEIGARCTRIRTGENIDILVPNSGFLEKNITNWTLSDNNIRALVTVGLAYGSPVRRVRSLLLEAVTEIPGILKSPEPFVIFKDFGDNALIFDLFFWVSINRVIERKMIESDVRFRIDDLFKEAGLVIAFPQRDVHLDTQRPLDVRLLPNGKEVPADQVNPTPAEGGP